ncbi:pyrimidine operon attenuation protein / uracil phosphoribosyltransferase [Zhouia amylolytica]|uniref:Pyrimidine operon attenuation protein/uracil phosphoribosyltransferase n=2 Tax=Zhouia amylolytica TaxID=376730 RepID=W2ULW9_9FLAO|nr:phosphoribosyltransferase family protein [Zhouia amylolytica]ETN95165.1 pyrimidine operon attenuation protein/uracil phosphoribosyltransferase [Zhouia amylolytica AD3]MCQ0111882.1 phosphoribosyltransferase [Zhouia amylolytica]SFS68165.1 pyrimidine operon attenuation protein / uracil phosphoribosyltransferase [Zhouia amylolytica]
MTSTQNKILGHDEIQHKIKRIAYQIYETFVEEDEIIIAGIAKGGLDFAKKLQQTFNEIADIKTTICEVVIDKQNPLAPISTSLDKTAYQNKAIVLADDVLNTGGTLIYGVKHFLNVPLKKFKTVVLVDRNHKKYPIKADFKGISLSTSLQEHVEVVFEENNDAVFLH